MSKKYVGKICPYCKTQFVEDDTVVFCSVCDMPHHLSCWQDNQGCTTFGCTGSIKEIIENDSKAAAAPAAPQPGPAPVAAPKPVQATPAKPAPASAQEEQTENPIEILHESKEMVFMSDVPIVLENTAIIIDRTKDKLFARCTFRSITDKAIKAALIEISCQDVWGNTLGEPIAFQYIDLKTNRDSKFGETTTIDLQDKITRKIKVSVKKVLFDDDTVVSGGSVAFTMPAPILLSEHLGSEELAAEYARETTPNAQFVPETTNDYWRCTCGSLNTETEEKCHSCSCTKANLTAALSPDVLNANMRSFATAKRAAEEKAKLEQEERIRAAEEQVRLEQIKKEQEIFLAESKEKKKKRRKKTIAGITISLVVIAVLACGVYFFGIPYYHYRNACTALDNGKYDVAYRVFKDLGSFMDSEDMANEALYQKGEAALKNKQYDSAIQTFGSLGNYKDSKSQVLEAKYLKAKKYQYDKKYKEAYRLFVELDDYKESQDNVLTTILLWETEALEASSTSSANDFSKTVKLSPSHYEMFYATILLHLDAHDNSEYWFRWFGTSASRNVHTMLTLLPSSYKDTATLLELFSLFEDIYVGYEELFRDNDKIMRKCWQLDFVQDLAEQDEAICYFLEDYWSTYSGDYYINFYESDNGNTGCSSTLPWVAAPYGTKYYNIKSLIYIHEDSDGNELAKVYRFEIVDYDTIKVFCYKNNRTYTLYR